MKKTFLADPTQADPECIGININRGIASNKYQVHAENKKHPVTSMKIDVVELKLRLENVNAISEYSGENIIFSMSNCMFMICFP